MEENTRYRILIISIFFVIIIFGIYIGFMFGNKSVTDYATPVVNTEDDGNVAIYKEPENIIKKYDIEVVYEDYYTLCGETIKTSKTVKNTTIDELKKSEISKVENDKYKIVEESKDKLVFRKEIAEYCPNHFKVYLENDVVVVYSMVDDNTNRMYNKLEITKDLIREELIEELKKGIRVNSIEELNLLLEDLES
jgi:galactitol-specific phosphotransferase system IIB component